MKQCFSRSLSLSNAMRESVMLTSKGNLGEFLVRKSVLKLNNEFVVEEASMVRFVYSTCLAHSIWTSCLPHKILVTGKWWKLSYLHTIEKKIVEWMLLACLGEMLKRNLTFQVSPEVWVQRNLETFQNKLWIELLVCRWIVILAA